MWLLKQESIAKASYNVSSETNIFIEPSTTGYQTISKIK